MVTHFGDADWRVWLDTTAQKTFRYIGPSGTFTGRRETKAERTYWYAYRKSGGRLRKAYLGRTEDLTPERLEAIAAQLADAVQPVAASASQVPMPAHALIGREAELQRIARRLLDGGGRLLTLTGPGGTGKTRLAIAVARDGAVAQHFRDGVAFVDLSPIVDPELVVREIARHLGIQDVGETPVRDRLHHHLARRRVLLVLDNMEQVITAGVELADLRDACPHVHLLVTSREALHVADEVTYPVAPLDVPDLARTHAPEDLGRVASVALFVARAHDAGSQIELSETTARDVAELCVRLDGLPLAIELAAARARLLRPRDMLNRITRQLELLRSRDGRPARHESLRAAVAWSYELLEEPEQRAFRWLAVFAGGCTLDAAEAVLGDDSALDHLASLVDKSLLVSEPGPDGGTRLRMLETIRIFGLEQLDTDGETGSARLAHAGYYLAQVRPSSWDALDLPTPEWLAHVTPEHDNIRAALRWSLDAGAPQKALELAAAVQGFWMLSGYLREGLRWIELALASAEGLDTHVEAWTRHAAGQIAWRLGDYDRATRPSSSGSSASPSFANAATARARRGLP